MEHTDAGVHTVLVDVERPDEYHPYPGEDRARSAVAEHVRTESGPGQLRAPAAGITGDGPDRSLDADNPVRVDSSDHSDRPTDPDPEAALAAVIELGLGDLIGEAMEWQERALCAQTDPEAFFPEKGGSTREAKRICSGCEVRVECLEYALENDERFGIWGGMSERERRKQRRRAG
jgi:WhiB family redox-sensing transcriptional regulator